MRKIATICALVLAMCGIVKMAQAQTINITQGETVRQSCKLNASAYTVDPMGTTLLISYDMDAQEITLRMALERGIADHLWIPLKNYDDQMLEQAIKQNLNGKMSMNKPFKHQIVFGLTSAFECVNCKPIATTANGIKQELYGRKDTAVFRFHVTDPHASVGITIRTCVPVQTTETASGKIRYTFLYVPDKISLKLNVPTDPCEEPAIAVLCDSIKVFIDTMNNANDELDRTVKQRKRGECIQCKRKVEEIYTPRLDTLRAWYATFGASCDAVESLLLVADSLMTEATSIQCPKSQPPVRVGGVTPPEPVDPVPPKKPVNQIAMEIRKHAEALDKCINNIRNNKEVEKNRTEGGRICAAAQKYIDKIDDKSKDDPQVKSAVKRYESAARSFRKFK